MFELKIGVKFFSEKWFEKIYLNGSVLSYIYFLLKYLYSKNY